MSYPAIDSYSQWTRRREVEPTMEALWHMLSIDARDGLVDDSGKGNHLSITGTTHSHDGVGIVLGGGTTLQLDPPELAEQLPDYLLQNLFGADGFTIGGFVKPTSADNASTWAILATTRQGTDHPIFHIALNAGKPHFRLYTSAGAQIVSYTYPIPLPTNVYTMIALQVGFTSGGSTAIYVTVGDVTTAIYHGATQVNSKTSNPLVMGVMDKSNYYRGAMTEWFTLSTLGGLGPPGVPLISNLTKAINNKFYEKIDFESLPGQIQLTRSSAGLYEAEGTYTTTPVDLGNAFPELGRVQLTGDIPYGKTEVIAETRTSSDGDNFSAWTYIDSNGRIQSPNYRYIQTRLTLRSLDGGYSSPRIGALGFEDYSPQAVVNQVKVIPEVRDGNNLRVAFLNKLRSLVLNDATNGEETLTFSMVYDEKASELENEFKVMIPGNEFYIRRIEDDDEGGKTIRTFYCEAAWYDLATKPHVAEFAFHSSYPDAPLIKALQGTGWSLVFVDSGFELRDMVLEGKHNPLKLIRGVQEVWGGDIVFDNVNKTVSLHNKNIDSGYAIRKRKNMKRIKRTIDTTGLITKLFPVGANDLTIAPANNGNDFIEDYSWFTNRGLRPIVKEAEWKDERFYSAYHLAERGRERLAQSAKPRLSYEIDILDLSAIPRFAHELPLLRTQALIDDEDIRTRERVKIVARELDLLQPWQSSLGLSTQVRELGDEGAMLAQETAGRLEDTDALGRTDMQELMVFNYLQNSRADQGMNHWIQNGNVTPDNSAGVTGTNSFRMEGSANGKQELSQTFWPSTRESYTISAQIATENLVKAPGAKVGVRVAIYYEGEADPEEVWLEL